MRSQVHMIQETVTTTQGRPDSHKAHRTVAFDTLTGAYCHGNISVTNYTLEGM